MIKLRARTQSKIWVFSLFIFLKRHMRRFL
nr:MAG TPA: hypothetical protein [Caudoviricetes sp.]